MATKPAWVRSGRHVFYAGVDEAKRAAADFNRFGNWIPRQSRKLPKLAGTANDTVPHTLPGLCFAGGQTVSRQRADSALASLLSGLGELAQLGGMCKER